VEALEQERASLLADRKLLKNHARKLEQELEGHRKAAADCMAMQAELDRLRQEAQEKAALESRLGTSLFEAKFKGLRGAGEIVDGS
jgi:hypothetical protein